jgi:hypothetical protein
MIITFGGQEVTFGGQSIEFGPPEMPPPEMPPPEMPLASGETEETAEGDEPAS